MSEGLEECCRGGCRGIPPHGGGGRKFRELTVAFYRQAIGGDLLIVGGGVSDWGFVGSASQVLLQRV
ncbi:hypothetical protein D3C81_1960040 [compost metagenome]